MYCYQGLPLRRYEDFYTKLFIFEDKIVKTENNGERYVADIYQKLKCQQI